MNSIDGELRQAEVKFLPWIGAKYADGFEGVRLLILGESHYNSAKKNQSIEEPDTTRRVVEWYIKPTTHFRFATNVQHLATRRPAVESERSKFWNSVAHYNYVQEFVGSESRIRPSRKMWDVARAPFLKVLDTFAPQAVLVLGYANWSHMFDFPEGPPLADKAGLGTSTGRLMPTSEGTALAFHTMHPSAAISPKDWYDRVTHGLQMAADMASK